VTLYQFLTRKLPFSSTGTATEVLEQIKQRIPPPPRTVDDKIPVALEEVCLKAMAKSPADRYRTAADMAAALRSAMSGAPPPKRGLWCTLAAGGAAAAVALAVWGPWRKHDAGQLHGVFKQEINSSEVNAIAKAVVQLGNLKLNVPRGTVYLDVYYLPAGDQGTPERLRGSKIVPREGDRIKFKATVKDEVPRYLYLYWYDTDGRTQRLWPKDPADQEKVTQMTEPAAENDWWALDASRGDEMVLAFVRDEPMTAEELAEFEQLRPYATGEIQRKTVYEFASKELSDELSRGLAAVVTARENPMSPRFKQGLEGKSSFYNGMVIPHQ
jgi:hypothetical protein